MISGDQLFRFERELDDRTTKDPSFATRLVAALQSIYELEGYQEWLNAEYPSITQYELHPGWGADVDFEIKRALDKYGLVNGGRLEVKVDVHLGRIHVTDGPWVPASYRVYSYSDESELICKYVRELSLDQGCDVLIDPAAGCGHHTLGLSDIPIRANLDINVRAAVYARVNALLSGSEKTLCSINDIRDGFPSILSLLDVDRVLVCVNMPFGIFPAGENLPTTIAQDGGDRGATLTFAAIDAVAGLRESLPQKTRLDFVLLFYSLGNGHDEWEVIEYAKRTLGSVTNSRILNESMWRVNGVKIQKSPMDLSDLKTKALCRHTYSTVEQPAASRGYDRLSKLFQSKGYTHLGYGLLHAQVQG